MLIPFYWCVSFCMLIAGEIGKAHLFPIFRVFSFEIVFTK